MKSHSDLSQWDRRALIHGMHWQRCDGLTEGWFRALVHRTHCLGCGEELAPSELGNLAVRKIGTDRYGYLGGDTGCGCEFRLQRSICSPRWQPPERVSAEDAFDDQCDREMARAARRGEQWP